MKPSGFGARERRGIILLAILSVLIILTVFLISNFEKKSEEELPPEIYRIDSVQVLRYTQDTIKHPKYIKKRRKRSKNIRKDKNTETIPVRDFMRDTVR